MDSRWVDPARLWLVNYTSRIDWPFDIGCDLIVNPRSTQCYDCFPFHCPDQTWKRTNHIRINIWMHIRSYGFCCTDNGHKHRHLPKHTARTTRLPLGAGTELRQTSNAPASGHLICMRTHLPHGMALCLIRPS